MGHCDEVTAVANTDINDYMAPKHGKQVQVATRRAGLIHDCHSDGGIYIVLDIRANHVLGTLDHPCALVQQRTRRLAMREHSHTSHDRLDRIRVDNALLDTWDEECRLSSTEVVVEVDEECEQT